MSMLICQTLRDVRLGTDRTLSQGPDFILLDCARRWSARGNESVSVFCNGHNTSMLIRFSICQELENKWWSAFVLEFMGLTIRAQDRDAAARCFKEILRDLGFGGDSKVSQGPDFITLPCASLEH